MNTRRANSVTISEMRQLLKLQELFHAHYLTEELLNNLIASYVRLVEVCSDSIPMRAYFLQRIQLVVSRPEINKMLEKADPNAEIRMTIRQTTGFISKLPDNSHQSKASLHETVPEESAHRGHKIQMQMKIMRQVESNMKQIQKQVSKADEVKEKNSAEIKCQIEKQEDELNARRALRKKKLRKKSADNIKMPQNKDAPAEEVPLIDKKQLIEAQHEIAYHAERITRMTSMRGQVGILPKNNKSTNAGRVKKKHVQPVIERENQEETVHKKQKEQASIEIKETPFIEVEKIYQNQGESKARGTCATNKTKTGRVTRIRAPQQPEKTCTQQRQKSTIQIAYQPKDHKQGSSEERTYEQIDQECF